jgi:FdhE protein
MIDRVGLVEPLFRQQSGEGFVFHKGVQPMSRTERKIEALRNAAIRSPEYAEIVPFFIAIQEYLLGREDKTGITVVTSATPKERNKAGFPLISASDLKIDQVQAGLFLAGLVDVVKLNGRGADDQIQKLMAAIESGQVDPAMLFTAILERRREPLEETASTLEIAAPLVEFLFEIPLRIMLEQFSQQYGADDVAGWQEGFCPICGSRAGMAEIAGEEGHRCLACSACNFKWFFRRIKCPYCGNEEAENQSYFTVDDGPSRVDVCKACQCYIKTRDSKKGDADIPLDITDALTIHLDLVAARERYERGK